MAVFKIRDTATNAWKYIRIGGGVATAATTTVDTTGFLTGLFAGTSATVQAFFNRLHTWLFPIVTEDLIPVTAVGTTSTLDLNLGRSFTVDLSLVLSGNHTIAFSNIPTGSRNISVTVFITTGATMPAINMPLGAYALTASKVNRVLMESIDNGVTWSYVNGGVR